MIEWELVGEKIVVNLDCESENGFPYIIDWGEEEEVVEPILSPLKDQVREFYEAMEGLADEEGGSLSEIQYNSRTIQEIFGQAFDKEIIQIIKQTKKKQKKSKEIDLIQIFEDCGANILKKCSASDTQFFEIFVKTQMFAYFVDVYVQGTFS